VWVTQEGILIPSVRDFSDEHLINAAALCQRTLASPRPAHPDHWCAAWEVKDECYRCTTTEELDRREDALAHLSEELTRRARAGLL
jgi:hypothetical protein